MAVTKILVALGAIALAPLAQATDFQLPPCLEPFRPFVYSGCFQDSAPKTLEYRSDAEFGNMTIEACVAECKGNGFRYAGLEYYGECYCGATVNSAALDEAQCSYPCTGNSSEICGGTDALSIYQDPTFTTHPNEVDIDDYAPLGCFTDDGTNGRALPWIQNIPQETFTPFECLSACCGRGFPFAGTEYAQECYCGSVMGNSTVEVPAEECNLPCRGDPSQTCGGSSRLNLYVARELLSLEPCGYTPPDDTTTTTSVVTVTSTSTSSVASSLSTESLSTSVASSLSTESSSTSSVASSSSTSPSSIPSSATSSATKSTTIPGSTAASSTAAPSTTAPSTTTQFTSTTRTTASVCTTTTIPPSDCEYKIGHWCAPHFPDFGHEHGCLDAWKTCAKLVTSCWKHAGFPAALECIKFKHWCGDIKDYCQNDCRGKPCSKTQCFDKYKPQNPAPPKPPVTTTIPCPTTTTIQTTIRSTATSVVPEPTNICKQPTSWLHSYGPGNPVGGIDLPLVMCNDLQQDFWTNPFKLYTEPDSHTCKKYTRPTFPDACKDACLEQFQECKDTYVESCSSRWSFWPTGHDSQYRANERCTSQYWDCLNENKYVSAGERCRNWGTGLRRMR